MAGRFWIVSGAILAGAAVAAGAIGTHFLKETLEMPAADLETYDVAVRYQMAHALALILVGILIARLPSRLTTVAGGAFLLGIMLFSGGIYAWLFTGIKPFVHVVPIGGIAWILGWLALAVGAATARAE